MLSAPLHLLRPVPFSGQAAAGQLDASAGAVEEVERRVRQIRSRWPNVRIVLRADRGFAREALMAWCEAHGVDYVFGLAKKARLLKQVEAECTRQNAITHTPNSRNGSSRSSPTKPEIVGVGNAEWSARPSTWKAAPTHTSS